MNGGNDPPEPTMNILIVDDNPTNLKLLRAIVEAERLTVFAAADGVEALQVLEREKIDAVISDILMPRMDGYQLCFEVRQHARLKNLPFILFTASYTSPDDEKLALDLGADKHIRKPLSAEVLVDVLREVTTEARYRQPRRILAPTEIEVLKEYSARLVSKLEETNTELHVRAEALADSRQKLDAIIQSVDGIVWEADAQTFQVIFVSQRAERLLGYACERWIKEPTFWSDHIHPEDRERTVNVCVKAIAEKKNYEFEYRMLAADGRVLWLHDIVSVIVENDRPTKLRGLMVDITARKRATDAFAESELRYRKLTEASFDGIAITVEGVITEANPGVAEIFGYPLDEVISRPILDFVADESLGAVRQRLGEDDEGRFELVGKHKDGRKIQLETTARRHNVSGRPGRILAVRDVTEKRVLEAQLRQAQKMDAVGQLAGGVAHDFNNLLTAILGYSNFVIDTFEPHDRRRSDMEEVIKAGQRAAALTSQLLAFSRKQVLQPTRVDLNALVTNMRQMLSRLIGEHVDLVPILASDLNAVRADPGQLEQVLMNLVINARDAMPSGGRLAVETANVELDQSLMRDVVIHPGSYVMLAVTDSGTGMSEATKQRLFEPFFTTKEPGTGTGLGLATVYGIVKQSGGYIWVSSEPGQGATFKVFLPCADCAGEVEQSIVSAEAMAGGTETVLVVEDEKAVRFLMRTILEKTGYRVFDAPNPQEAEALFEQHRSLFNLLVTDVIMPGSSGPTLFERLARQRPDLKVLYVSGYTDDIIVHQGQLDPGVEFLQKPFTADALNRRVREVLDR